MRIENHSVKIGAPPGKKASELKEARIFKKSIFKTPEKVKGLEGRTSKPQAVTERGKALTSSVKQITKTVPTPFLVKSKTSPSDDS